VSPHLTVRTKLPWGTTVDQRIGNFFLEKVACEDIMSRPLAYFTYVLFVCIEALDRCRARWTVLPAITSAASG
jgi:hypothetical protein